jgi:Protein of unknown function (DUF3987)
MSAADITRLDSKLVLQDFVGNLATLLGARTSLTLREGATRDDDYRCYPLMYLVKCGQPSSGKSASQSMVWRALKKWQKQESEKVQKARENLETLKEQWAIMDKNEKKENQNNPEINPSLFEKKYLSERKWIIEGGTPEAILGCVADQAKGDSLTVLMEELTQLGSLDQYKRNKGDSRQLILQNWNEPS